MNPTNQSKQPYAAIYIRVSTDEQSELSPETQLTKIQEYARQNAIPILPEHIYQDNGISGKKAEKRPQFMKMIADAKKPDCPFTVILVWKFSRFARNQEESIFYKSILRRKCGIDVVSISEPLLSGHFGSLIERIIEWMDEFYSIRLSEEVKRSMEVNARRGKLQASPPFGYRAEEGHLVIQPQEAALVRWMFQSCADGKELLSIARELNGMGAVTHRGNPFERRTVEYILQNPVYIGKLRWNPTGKTQRDFDNENLIIADADHIPLVSQDIWDIVQQRFRKGIPQTSNSRLEYTHWLSGLIRCSSCGGTLVFTKPHYYRCGNYAKGRCQSSQHIHADLLSDAILTQLRHDALTISTLRHHVVDTTLHQDTMISQLTTSLRELSKKQSRLQKAYLSGIIDLEAFSIAKKELDTSSSDLQHRLAQLQELTNEDGNSHLQERILNAIDTLIPSDISASLKNQTIRSVIDFCIFDKETLTLTITYRAEL